MAEDNKKKTQEPAKKAPEVKKEEPKKETTYIMQVTHLAWGKNGMNHFYASKKPLISKKVMRNYASTLDLWIKNGWVKEGSY
jgi:hypothetical protein